MKKFKGILSFTLALVLMACAVPMSVFNVSAAATSGSCGANVKWRYSSGTLTLSGTGETNDYRTEINGNDTILKKPWESFSNNINKIVIKDGITYIGSNIFAELKNLKTVSFGNTLGSIGNFAFWDCKKLQNFTLPDSLYALCQECFSGCSSITTVKVPDKLTFFDAGVFSRCTSLKTAYIGGSSVGGYTNSYGLFTGSTALTKITVSSKNIAFSSVDGVLYSKDKKTLIDYPIGRKDKTVKIPEGVTDIAIDAMRYAKCEYIVLPTTIKSIGEAAVEDMPNLISIKNTSNRSISLADNYDPFYVDGKKVTVIKPKQTVYTARKYTVKSVKLSTTEYSYNGKTKTPKVTVTAADGTKLKSGKDYTVTYPKKRKNVGTYTVKVKMKGLYKGTKKVTFKILPRKTSVEKVTAGKKSLTIKWAKKKTQVSGYQIRYSTSSSMKNAKKVKITDTSTTSYTKTKLKSGKKYYVQVRTYKRVDGKNYYSAWSDKVSKKVK